MREVERAMKSIKVVCIHNFDCPYPYDQQKTVPFEICLLCGGLYIVKESDER